MKNGGIRKVVFGAVLLAAAGGLWAADHYRVVNGPKDFYFGHISYIEPTCRTAPIPIVLREGRAEPEQGVLNLPIGPGDTIRTSADRRCEIQFDTGTIVRLDVATEVRVETILARSLSSLDELSVLTLGKGRIYVMYKEYDRKEMFQVLTPNAAVKMKHNSVALVTAAADGTHRDPGEIRPGPGALRAGRKRSLDDRTVKKGERLIVLKDHQFELAAAIDDYGLRALEQGCQRPFRRPPRRPDGAPQAHPEAAAGRLLLRPDLRQPLRRMALGRFLRLCLAPVHRQRRLPLGLEPVLLRPLVLLRRPDVLGAPGALGLDPVSSRHLAVGQEARLGLAARLDVRPGLGDLGFLFRLRLLAAVEPLRLDVRRSVRLDVRLRPLRAAISIRRTGGWARLPDGPDRTVVRRYAPEAAVRRRRRHAPHSRRAQGIRQESDRRLRRGRRPDPGRSGRGAAPARLRRQGRSQRPGRSTRRR